MTMIDVIRATGKGSVTLGIPQGLTSFEASLEWWPDLGLGYLHTPELVPYDDEYWEKYQSYRGNGIGEKITKGRARMTRYALDVLGLKADSKGRFPVTDVGIGSGEFVEAMPCFGTDVNPKAIAWLKSNKLYHDPLAADPVKTPILTFWDVLEHIPDPKPLLDKAEIVLTSIPIHANVEACLASKHLRPGEHLWHFTPVGIKTFMDLLGFKLVSSEDFEVSAGREGIMSYMFKRYK